MRTTDFESAASTIPPLGHGPIHGASDSPGQPRPRSPGMTKLRRHGLVRRQHVDMREHVVAIRIGIAIELEKVHLHPAANRMDALRVRQAVQDDTRRARDSACSRLRPGELFGGPDTPTEQDDESRRLHQFVAGRSGYGNCRNSEGRRAQWSNRAKLPTRRKLLQSTASYGSRSGLTDSTWLGHLIDTPGSKRVPSNRSASRQKPRRLEGLAGPDGQRAAARLSRRVATGPLRQGCRAFQG